MSGITRAARLLCHHGTNRSVFSHVAQIMVALYVRFGPRAEVAIGQCAPGLPFILEESIHFLEKFGSTGILLQHNVVFAR